MNFNAIVFDMDGLLVETEPLWTIAEKELIGKRGGVLDMEVRKQIIGLRGQEIVAHFKAVYRLQDSVEILHRELDAHMVALVNGQVKPKQGATQLLAALHEQKMPLAVASSSTNALINAVLGNKGWDHYFGFRCSAEDEINGKPAPDVYLKACRLLGERPDHCLAIEDSLNGAKAAVAAGMACYVIPSSGVFPDPRFDEFGLQQFENLMDVKTFIGA